MSGKAAMGVSRIGSGFGWNAHVAGTVPVPCMALRRFAPLAIWYEHRPTAHMHGTGTVPATGDGAHVNRGKFDGERQAAGWGRWVPLLALSSSVRPALGLHAVRREKSSTGKEAASQESTNT